MSECVFACTCAAFKYTVPLLVTYRLDVHVRAVLLEVAGSEASHIGHQVRVTAEEVRRGHEHLRTAITKTHDQSPSAINTNKNNHTLHTPKHQPRYQTIAATT